jgi:hypothetical protein
LGQGYADVRVRFSEKFVYYQDYQGSSGTSRKSDEIWIHYQNYQGSSLIGKIGNIWK